MILGRYEKLWASLLMSGEMNQAFQHWPMASQARCWRICALVRPITSYPAQGHTWPDAAQWLHQAWEVDDHDTLVTALLWLSAQGERQRWDIDARMLQAMDETERNAWREAHQDTPYARPLTAFIAHQEPLDWAAWDWLRMAELAWAGACCGYLTQQDADHFAAHAVDLLSQRYADWKALLNAFVRGFTLFKGEDQQRCGRSSVEQALLTSADSPWAEPFHQLLDNETREASRRAIRRWREGPCHWLLALAGVREPALMLRQGAGALVLPEARRMEVAHFLQDSLGLHADEGTAALARYWLPAQAHHLNQLAADAAHGIGPPQASVWGEAEQSAQSQQAVLKTLSCHSATIHMAEKFAFYLHMALDSQLFDQPELLDYVAALKSSLCRFYPDAHTLLQAWLAWEQCLPENDSPSLQHEIAWHLEDPGSLFHWLDWHPGAWCEPGVRPTLGHYTAMALAGPLNSAAWGEPFPESEREKNDILTWVDNHYQLQNAEEFNEFIRFMMASGDRQEYQINYAPYTLNPQRLAAEIAILESGQCGAEEHQHLLRLQRVRDNEDGCNELDMTAWDIAQIVDLAIAGRQLGWLTKATFNRLLDQAYALANQHYSSWQTYAEGLYAGFSFFMGDTPERESFLASLRQALTAWLCASPLLAGPWASLDFPGIKPRHFAPLHSDTLPGDQRTLH